MRVLRPRVGSADPPSLKTVHRTVFRALRSPRIFRTARNPGLALPGREG